ncbi:MAG: TolC family protein, partial [Bacteroidota bacterium]
MPIKITFINDKVDEAAQQSEVLIKQELQPLLQARFTAEFETIEVNSPEDFATISTTVYQSETNLVIGVGFEVSNYLSSLKEYPKPTIISFMLDHKLQGLPDLIDEGSGVANLHYIESPFDISLDLQTLYEITPYQKLGFVLNANASHSSFDLASYFDQLVSSTGAAYELFTIEDNADGILTQMNEDVDAVYLLPILEPGMRTELEVLLQELARRGIPTFSLLSDPAIELGAYAAHQTNENFARIPRRVALSAMKILEGQRPETLPVTMDNYTKNLIINMQTARTARVYPSWDMMAEAILINVTLAETTGRELTLQSAIAEGLNNNLNLKIAQKDVGISIEDVQIAKSNYLPQIDASATVLALDDATVSTSFGARGRYNLQAGATLTQLLLSEPAMANVAIQKLLLRGQEEALRQNQLDVVQEVTEAYLGILQATALVRLRNENVGVTRQ